MIINLNKDFSRAKNESYQTYVTQQISSSLGILTDSELVLRPECGSSWQTGLNVKPDTKDNTIFPVKEHRLWPQILMSFHRRKWTLYDHLHDHHR